MLRVRFSSSARRLLLLIVASLGLTSPATAEAPFNFATTPGKLPKHIVPTRYTLRIEPDVVNLTFTGMARIELNVAAPAPVIQLNALDLTIASAVLRDGGQAGQALPHTYDADRQVLTLTPAAPLDPGTHVIELTYAGVINPQAAGLFYDDYPTADDQRRMLGTQMEPTDGRRVFPGWDEPAFRATFDITLVVPSSFTAVSNMPAVAEEALPGDRKAVSFARSPSMPTYLVALFAGEFEAVEGDYDGIKLRILTTAGKSAQAHYALEATRQILAYYDDYFGLRYPLPKLDQIGVPNAFSGFSAMENWGAISYIDTALLYDPATSSQSTKENVFITVAHELAHQWFGNLVTMAWWDNLWLNESFATWMETKTTDALNPAWRRWLRAGEDKSWVMGLDSRISTHPIQQVVATEAEAAAGFDAIAYEKGRAFIRMLEDYVGESAFRDGVRLYLQRHRLSNTTSADLWAALSEASGLAVGPFAASWVEQSGFPLVDLALEGPPDAPRLIATQSRFSYEANPTPSPVWQIPLTLAPLSDPTAVTRVLLTAPRTEILLPAGFGPLKANHEDIGVYRVNYDAELRAALIAGLTALPVADQLNLLADTWALSRAGRLPATQSLELVSVLRESTDPTVLSQVVDTINTIDSYQTGRPGRAAWCAWAIATLSPILDRVGWSPAPGEREIVATLRGHLVGTLGQLGDPTVIAEAYARFPLYLADPTSLPPDLIRPVLNTVGRQAEPATYDQLLALARGALATELKTDAYNAAARAIDPALARRTLALALDPATPTSVANYLPITVARHGEHPDLVWSFVVDRLDELLARVTPMERYDYAANIAGTALDAARARELLALYAEKFPPDAAPMAARAAEGIRTRVEFRHRELDGLDAWIAARPVARPE